MYNVVKKYTFMTNSDRGFYIFYNIVSRSFAC